METLKFKTNIKCSGCVAQSTPYLNEVVGKETWKVDINSPEKTLTVQTSSSIDPGTVIKAVEDAGFKAEAIS